MKISTLNKHNNRAYSYYSYEVENPIMIVSHFSGNFKDYLNLVRHTGHMEERRFFRKYYKNLM